MKKNSLNIIIVILIILICLVSFFLLFDNQEIDNNELIFELYGEEYTYHNLDTPYFDPGVRAICCSNW